MPEISPENKESHPWATRSLLSALPPLRSLSGTGYSLEMTHASLSTGYPSEQELLMGLMTRQLNGYEY